MGVASGNPLWVDYPSTSTLITATALNNQEAALDSAAAGVSTLRTALFGGPSRTRPPAAYVYYAADSSTLAANTNYLMASGWAKYADPDGMVTIGGNSDTLPTELTAPVDGMYLCEWHLVSSATSGAMYARFLLNQNTSNSLSTRVVNQSFGSQAAGGTEATHLHFALTRNLAAGDRVGAAIYSTVSFVLRATYFGQPRQTMFGIRYVGPLQAP